MKLPLLWLKDYVSLNNNLPLLTNKLTAIGHMQDHKPQTVKGEVVLDLEIRQNRPDCLSITGLAREIATVLGKNLSLPPSFAKKLPIANNKLNIINKSANLCYRFNTLSFENVKVGKSPKWLSKRLEVYGIKSINNLVDITNFVMVETGQPLHPFNTQDLNKQIIIRKAKNGESIIVLGNKKIKLSNDDLVIANKTETLAIAGVIGSLPKAINNNASNITLEAANYNQASIRKTALKYNLRTEASLRNEKFLNPKMTEVALSRASELILDLCGGKLVSHTDHYPKPVRNHRIVLNLAEIKRLGGLEIEKKEVKNIFSRLGISVTGNSPHTITATIPYFRTDLKQEADLVEEVLRIYGYDKIPNKLLEGAVPKNIHSLSYLLEEEIRDLLVGLGFDEEITEPLTKENNPKLTPIFLENSLNTQKTMLRTSLKNNLLDVLKNKKKYKKNDILIFEIGKIYFKMKGDLVEQRTLGGISSTRKISYLNVKGIIEILLERLGYKYSKDFVKIETVNEKDSTFYFEINLDKLLSRKKNLTQKILTSPPQIIFEDLSIVMPKNIQVGEVIDEIKNTSPLIYKLELGEPPRHKKNVKTVFLKLSYSSPDKTLKTKDIVPIRKMILKKLAKNYKSKLRQ